MAASPQLDKIAIYVPYSNNVQVNLDLNEYGVEMIELSGRNVLQPVIEINGHTSTIAMHDSNSDVLIIGLKKKVGLLT